MESKQVLRPPEEGHGRVSYGFDVVGVLTVADRSVAVLGDGHVHVIVNRSGVAWRPGRQRRLREQYGRATSPDPVVCVCACMSV